MPTSRFSHPNVFWIKLSGRIFVPFRQLFIAGFEVVWVQIRPLWVVVVLSTFAASGAAAESPQEASGNAIEVTQDVPYATGASYARGRGLLDIYLPARTGNAPVLMFIHGGGLNGGDKRRVAHIGRRFASEGFITVCSNYRLSPVNTHPAHIEDRRLYLTGSTGTLPNTEATPTAFLFQGGPRVAILRRCWPMTVVTSQNTIC